MVPRPSARLRQFWLGASLGLLLFPAVFFGWRVAAGDQSDIDAPRYFGGAAAVALAAGGAAYWRAGRA